jgi:hypothetical protein
LKNWSLKKVFQQDTIADMELIIGVDMSKKVFTQNSSKRDSAITQKNSKTRGLYL